MKAVLLISYGFPEEIEFGELEKPTPDGVTYADAAVWRGES